MNKDIDHESEYNISEKAEREGNSGRERRKEKLHRNRCKRKKRKPANMKKLEGRFWTRCLTERRKRWENWEVYNKINKRKVKS